MNEYWSNEDDKKVSYRSEQPPRHSRADGVRRMPEGEIPAKQPEPAPGALSYQQPLARRESAEKASAPKSYPSNYGSDRSTFISDDPPAQRRSGSHYAAPPKFDRQPPNQPPQQYSDGDGYQVRSDHHDDPGGGGRRGRGWLIFIIVLLVLALIGGGTYVFRYQILDLVGNIFGEEIVWKIMPTPAPTETIADVPAYVKAAKLEVKPRPEQEIQAVTGDLNLEAYLITDLNIVLREANPNGAFDFYLFAADTGRLLGYYEEIDDLISCNKNMYYIAQPPYLITSRGFPLVNLNSFARSTGGEVKLHPMINGWALVSDLQGTTLNFVGEDGKLISDLWFAKAFPFTADTTLAYVDTGNLTDASARYALYLLKLNGETRRLSYMPDWNGVLESVCGMAFMQTGEMHAQDETLPLVTTTDDVSAYVNCSALVVRQQNTGLYGLFVDGVQQYPFEFDEIIPMPSDLVWAAYENGYVKRYTVANQTYPLPRSYSFILRRGETEQIVSIASSSDYPIVFD